MSTTPSASQWIRSLVRPCVSARPDQLDVGGFGSGVMVLRTTRFLDPNDLHDLRVRAAVSLPEVLVVAAIIAFMLALLVPGLDTVREGEACGPLLGGTLTQLVASLGTPYAFAPPSGYVLLLDEVGERPYRIDRMLTQLTASGVLARAAAVVCGTRYIHTVTESVDKKDLQATIDLLTAWLETV
ncbi:MAG: hypothetical protein IID42_00600 [Planctomycetes bacterium]|nr:hypothetical protein [Planctomycetota bacterium]